MKKRLTMALAAGALVLAMVPAAASAAPCETGREYAQEHIKPLATTQGLGNGGHKPGAHQGFSNVPDVCA